MNGAVETRSNWKGLNAGLREVPSMAAMSFAVVGEGEDVRNTRERALKSVRDESHPLLLRVPSKRHCQRNDLRVAKRGRHRRNWRENERQIASVRKRTGHRGCLIRFYPEFVYGISLKWDEKTEKKNSITFQKDASWCLKAHAWKKSKTYVSHAWARQRHDKGTPMLGHHRLSA